MNVRSLHTVLAAAVLVVPLLFASRPLAAEGAVTVPVAVHETTITACRDFLRSGSTLETAGMSGDAASRPVISLLLLEKGLEAGGLNAEIVFIPAPNESRHRKNIESGRALMFGADMWNNAAGDKYHRSAPLIPAGDFAKLFCFRAPDVAARIRSADDLRKYKGIVVENWVEDRKVLERLNLPFITAPTWKLMWRMLEHGRGDYVFLEPGCDTGPKTAYGVKAFPIQGLKASFPEGRSFLVYKNHPDGQRIFEHLQKGLKILRKKGIIHNALTRNCILNDQIRDWTDLSAEPAAKK